MMMLWRKVLPGVLGTSLAYAAFYVVRDAVHGLRGFLLGLLAYPVVFVVFQVLLAIGRKRRKRQP